MTPHGAYGVWDTAEQRYVDEVRQALRDVPRRQRRELTEVVAADLAERPGADGWEELVVDVGDPAVCAAALRAEHGLPAHVGVGARLRAVRATTWVVLAGLLLLAGGGAAYQRWSTADPGFINFCGGVPTGEPGLTDPRVPVEDKEAAGASELVLGYVDGARVVLPVCLIAQPGVEVLEVDVPHTSRSIFQSAVVHASNDAGVGDVRTPTLDGPVPVSHDGLMLTVAGRMANCEWYSPGGGTGFDTVEVTYRYRGRTRTVPIALNSAYTFQLRDAEDCPRTRPDD